MWRMSWIALAPFLSCFDSFGFALLSPPRQVSHVNSMVASDRSKPPGNGVGASVQSGHRALHHVNLRGGHAAVGWLGTDAVQECSGKASASEAQKRAS